MDSDIVVDVYGAVVLCDLNLTDQQLRERLITMKPSQKEKVVILMLDRNKLTTLPDELLEFPSLVWLHVRANSIIYPGPILGRLTTLETLDMRNNQVVTLPKSLVNLEQLWRYVS
jgi:Leucine-rich repeat (LRR) protein